MKEISLREMQQIEFALLQEFDAVCKKKRAAVLYRRRDSAGGRLL